MSDEIPDEPDAPDVMTRAREADEGHEHTFLASDRRCTWVRIVDGERCPETIDLRGARMAKLKARDLRHPNPEGD